MAPPRAERSFAVSASCGRGGVERTSASVGAARAQPPPATRLRLVVLALLAHLAAARACWPAASGSLGRRLQSLSVQVQRPEAGRPGGVSRARARRAGWALRSCEAHFCSSSARDRYSVNWRGRGSQCHLPTARAQRPRLGCDSLLGSRVLLVLQAERERLQRLLVQPQCALVVLRVVRRHSLLHQLYRLGLEAAVHGAAGAGPLAARRARSTRQREAVGQCCAEAARERRRELRGEAATTAPGDQNLLFEKRANAS